MCMINARGLSMSGKHRTLKFWLGFHFCTQILDSIYKKYDSSEPASHEIHFETSI